MTDDPRGYDREFTTIINQRAQIRAGLSTERGDVTRFFVQLEYWLIRISATVYRTDRTTERDRVRNDLH